MLFCVSDMSVSAFFCANRMKKRNNVNCAFLYTRIEITLAVIFCVFILEKRLFSGVSRQTKCPLINIQRSVKRV